MDGNHPNRKKDKLNPYILSRQAGRYFLSFKDGQGVQHEIGLDELLYNEKELERLFQVVKGDPIELGVILAAFYGLRRSEAVGLKWNAIDFEKKTLTIRHTVTQVCVDEKSTVIEKDRTKTKSSYRTLPLIPPFEELLYRLKARQEQNCKLCGGAYCKKDADYIYVNEIGELVKPGFITQHFSLVL